MGELLLGIDIGTSSAKGVLTRPDGAVVASATRAHRPSMPRPGWVEHDAERDWWQAVTALSRQLLARADGPPAAVCISGIGPCVLATDADFRPLRPAILYGVDTRASAEVRELTEHLGEREIVAAAGSVLTSQSAGPKLLWLHRYEPDVWERTARVSTASSFAVARLTGEYVLDHHSASQYQPMYDLHGQRWNEEWSAVVAPGLALPRLAWPGDVVGHTTRAAAAETGIPEGTPVAAGTVDAWAEALSVGVQRPGDTMVMYGTTMFLVQMLPALVTDPRVWATRGLAEGSACLAGGMASSGAITDWLRRLSGEDGFDDLVAEAGRTAPGAHGLVMLPYFAGERTPLFDPDARGAVLGLTLRHTRAHLYRAALEATGYAVRHHLEVFAQAGAPPQRLVAVGGGTRGGLWTQIVSDITGCPQELPEQTIGASYGDALLAARAVGLARSDADWTRRAEVVQPRTTAAPGYDALYRIYRDAYPATRELMHALATIQRGDDHLAPVETFS
ncbi:FGGY-family carbohydrate kinase [Pseudonocardia kunmingensis]|uniref:Xylulokinase n=1 Tax=Pseudonocardia kunmingensis TaxID=630975 RepID=A0A543DQ17_9PSEU|nr:FGGY-family carbohydrate kinase [Pseudonocardia kunmingensis]TQM11403.1 xylulokinase [Pseudonocardia kunmingensis]